MTTLVENQNQLALLAERLRPGTWFYLDTEFDSRAKGVTLCLIQLYAEGDIHIIDTLALRDLQPLAAALGDPTSTWILHGAHQDIPLLQRALGLVHLPQLFDTQIVWGLLSPEPATSFAYLNYKLLGIRSSKQHQTDDWTRRPLTRAQLDYVVHDVETLPRLHELLLRRIENLSRVQLAADACRELLVGANTGFEPLSLDSYRNAWQLQPAGQRALVALIDWYNALTPREREVAPEAKLLWSLANRLPKSIEMLHQVRGLPRSLVPVHQQTILSIMRAADSQWAQATPPLEPPPYATFERLQLDAWLEYVRNVACAKAQVAKELVLAGHRLRRLKTPWPPRVCVHFNPRSCSTFWAVGKLSW